MYVRMPSIIRGQGRSYMSVEPVVVNIPVITIDGPSGSGKGAISRALARELDWHYLDSGALYRLLAFAATHAGVALDDADGLVGLAARVQAGYSAPPTDRPTILLDGKDINAELRTEAVGEAASKVAALPAVRAALLDWQRDHRREPGLVADGRDMGTVVFADAPLKLFLTASPAVRAERRYKQLKDIGKEADLSALETEVAARDARDSGRRVAPLVPAADAVVLDNSAQGEAATLAAVLGLVRDRL